MAYFLRNKSTESARTVAKLVGLYKGVTGSAVDDVLCDLLCDIMHWARIAGYDFALALDNARVHYDAERVTNGCEGPNETNK